ncbi:hypothetical protein, partial [Methylobacterium radiotolerans]|uniref:hypothetical protein n=1 Tax=Methylobacterium radiotolerans TaxID=31998 RepID=UPI000B9238F9
MIRLDKITKQNGRQLVFIEASAALQRGEKVGLVGPNGAQLGRAAGRESVCRAVGERGGAGRDTATNHNNALDTIA